MALWEVIFNHPLKTLRKPLEDFSKLNKKRTPKTKLGHFQFFAVRTVGQEPSQSVDRGSTENNFL